MAKIRSYSSVQKGFYKFFSFFLLCVVLSQPAFFSSKERNFLGNNASADTGSEASENDDYDLYEKYKNYLAYKHRKDYRTYKDYKEKYGFDSEKEKALYKERYEQYKLYKKDSAKYKQYADYWDYYKKYRGYKEKYKPTTKYKVYKKYNQSKYAKAAYKRYGTSKYKNGYDRYKRNKKSEANLGGGSLGPEISVGLWAYTKSNLSEDSFRIQAKKPGTDDDDVPYLIKNKSGATIASIGAGKETRIKYLGDQKFRIYNSVSSEITASDELVFTAANSSDQNNIVFETNLPITYKSYRDKMVVRYFDASSSSNDRIWVVNYLPLEHYVWGMGEITGTGDMDYNRVMTTSYRTYGYWKIKYSTKYAKEGFKVNATPGNQLYYGHTWENNYSRIKEAAIDTRGQIVMYGDRIAITPYSSWTDGRTRSWEERWGSDNYPWCKSVKDPYGKHATMSTKQLEAAGNHMVGMSAHGALELADDHDWEWQKILKYYYSGITLKTAY